MKKKTPIFLIIIGIIIFSLPFIAEKILILKASNITNNKISKEEIKNNKKSETNFNYNLVSDVSVIEASKPFSDKSIISKNTIGYLSIESINLELPILNGTTDENLFLGATTMRPDQKMGEGNYPLAGHYMKNPELLFGGLMNINIGDKVFITDLEHIYEYEIIDSKIVPDTSLDLIEDSYSNNYNEPIISLMTCYYTSKSEKRFFAFGKLINITSYED